MNEKIKRAVAFMMVFLILLGNLPLGASLLEQQAQTSYGMMKREYRIRHFIR